ncbi:hypothetical protein GC176_07520 [bacterium]|nr:hypothetical protein [bacterium]
MSTDSAVFPDEPQLDAETAERSAGDPWEVEFAEASPTLIIERDGVDVTSYRLPPCPHVLHHPLCFAGWLIRAVFGIVSLTLLLAVVAAVPVVNFLALGYLLEVEGRVARTGRLRDAFLLLDVAPRIGSIVLGTWLWILPLRLAGAARRDAYFIEPGGPADRFWSVFAPILAMLIGTHICLALARGGSLSCFFRPIKNVRWLLRKRCEADYTSHATAAVQDFVGRLRLKHHFWLGLRGFAGAFLWLVIPTAMFAAAGPDKGPQNLLAFLGAIGLILVFGWLPFLQARFALTGRFRSMFELRVIRRLYRDAPIAWLFAITVVYVLALPLYLPKVFLLPQDAMWLITLVFIATIYPARVMTGWALHRAMTRERKPWFGWRWLSRTIMLPLLALYVFLLFFTPLIGEHGKGVLFEHHALLLPVPF